MIILLIEGSFQDYLNQSHFSKLITMNYHQLTRIINQSLCLVVLAAFLTNCSSRGLDVLEGDTNKSWDGVQHAEIKQKFKAFVGGWEGMTYEGFLDRVAQAVKKQAAYKHASKKGGSAVAYYIPMEYIPSEDEKTIEKLKMGPFYQVAFQQEYPRISGKLKMIYASLLLLPNKLIRSKDANLFVVACFLRFTERVDQVLKDPTIDNGALIKQLNNFLDDFRSEIKKVDRQSDQYPNKNKATVAMGMAIIPNGEEKIDFVKNTVASLAMNARCMLTKPLAHFLYEQYKEIKAEIGKLDKALKEAAKKVAKMEEPE